MVRSILVLTSMPPTIYLKVQVERRNLFFQPQFDSGKFQRQNKRPSVKKEILDFVYLFIF